MKKLFLSLVIYTVLVSNSTLCEKNNNNFENTEQNEEELTIFEIIEDTIAQLVRAYEGNELNDYETHKKSLEKLFDKLKKNNDKVILEKNFRNILRAVSRVADDELNQDFISSFKHFQVIEKDSTAILLNKNVLNKWLRNGVRVCAITKDCEEMNVNGVKCRRALRAMDNLLTQYEKYGNDAYAFFKEEKDGLFFHIKNENDNNN